MMETSSWFDLKKEKLKPLTNEISADVIIVGGGISGMTAAYLLARNGKRTVLLEKGSLYDSTTAYTTAFITYIIDTSLSTLIKMFGEEKAKSIWKAGQWAINMIEEIIGIEKIDCDFLRCPEYIFSRNKKQEKEILQEIKIARALNFPFEKGEKLPFNNFNYETIPNQAKFHPLKYLAALREKALFYGALIFEDSEVKQIEGSKPYVIKTDQGSVKAPFVFFATYDTFTKPKRLFAHKGSYVSYIIESQIPPNILDEALYLDRDNPYHYFRVDKNGKNDRIILGGEDHRAEIKMSAEKKYRRLEDYMKEILNDNKYLITRRWSGIILEPVDGIPFIGEFSKKYPGQMIATGFSGNGMTYGTIAGQMFTDLVLQKENDWKKLFDPRRIPKVKNLWEKGKDYGQEFINGVIKEYFR